MIQRIYEGVQKPAQEWIYISCHHL